MDAKLLIRLGAVLFVAVVAIATIIEFAWQDDLPVRRAASVVSPSPVTGLRSDLRRCQRLGEQALRDQDCAKAWAESRDRFLKRITVPAADQASGSTATGAR